MTKLALIGAPSSAGAHHAGLERAPAALRRRGFADRLRARGLDAVDLGDLPVRLFATDTEYPKGRNAGAVVATARAVATAVAAARADGRTPVVVGGDCTVTLGVVAGVAASQATAGLLYFDGDADLTTPATTRSGILDAMVVAHLLGAADSPVAAALGAAARVPAERLALLGYDASDPDSFDQDLLSRHPGLFHVSGTRLAADPAGLARAARGHVERTADAVVVHFDVDAVDSADLPLADFPHYGVGQRLDAARTVLTELLATPRLAAVVLTEVNPTYDATGRDLDRYLEAVCAAIAAGRPAAPTGPGRAADPVTITRGGPADVEDLRPLWLSMHHHHQDAMPQLAPYVSDDESWALRRELYRTLLSRPDTVLLLARAGEALIGYGLAHVAPVEETWVADTWRRGSYVGEVESLAILPGQRGQGVGSRLLDGLHAELARGGVEDLVVGTLAGNHRARALYERNGYQPTWLYLSRAAGGAADAR